MSGMNGYCIPDIEGIELFTIQDVQSCIFFFIRVYMDGRFNIYRERKSLEAFSKIKSVYKKPQSSFLVYLIDKRVHS